MPKFKNRENERVELPPCEKYPEGRVIWLSRSCAVAITIIIRRGKERFCLMVKRGEGCPDERGRWVLPCGYLDWDETLGLGAARELFEETGFDFQKFIVNDIIENTFRVVCSFSNDGQPWFVNSGVDDGKQNVTHYFGAFIELNGDDDLPELTDKYCEPGEVAELKWVPVKDLTQYDIAFNHEKRIPMYLTKIRWNDWFISRAWRNLKRWVYKKD